MLSGSCYESHCMYWEMTLSSYIEGRQVKCRVDGSIDCTACIWR